MSATAAVRRESGLEVPEGWSTLFFLSVTLILVAWSIAEAGYGADLDSLVFVTFGAIVAGFFLAKSRFPGIIAHLFSFIYGTSWIAFLISHQLPATFTARDRLLELGYRLARWFEQAVLGGARGTDPLMFPVVMAILLWLLAYLAVWAAFRSHVFWLAVLPGGVALLINIYYGPDRVRSFLLPYLLFVLLFTVRFNLHTKERKWREDRVRYDPDIVYPFLRHGTVLIMVAVIVAWFIPAAATSERAEVLLARLGDPWERVKSEWIRLFSTLQSERTDVGYPSFGNTLGLGGPISLGNATLMDVRALTGRYWRAAVYDTYTGDGWVRSEGERVYLDAGESPGEMMNYEARRVVTQTFYIYMPGATQLYALGQPERFSIPVRADVLTVQDVQGRTFVESIAMVHSRHKLRDGEVYMVVSTVPAADEDAMRQAGNEYPAWVKRYLQLPDDLPQRVRDLAHEITDPYDNAYDKATALQDYLRQYKYNEQIAEPPPGVDRVDYFLFEMKEGYCNYYASAMAVMARAVGIPARVAAGYSRGDWVGDAGVFRVRELNSHAWVEVFLPRFGWVEFEPTAAEPAIVRPSVNANVDRTRPPPDYTHWQDYLDEEYWRDESTGMGGDFAAWMAARRRQRLIRTWSRVGGVAAVSLLIIVAAWWYGRRQADELRAAHVYYERMVRRAGWWGCKIEPHNTPHEYAARLSSSLADEEGERLVWRITNAYVGERFGKKNPARYQPDFAWRDLRPILTRWGMSRLWRRLWSAR